MDNEPTHFCGCTAQFLVESQTAAWRKRTLTWWLAGSLPNLSDASARQGLAEAFGNWTAVCGLQFREAGPGERPDIVCTTGVIDTAGKTLAWSELPDGSDRQLTQKYDQADAFVIAARPGRGQIDLVAVACHELGHALGLDHSAPGSGDLMEPTYQPGRRTPQPGDIRRIQALYGPPRPRPQPDPSGDTPTSAPAGGESDPIIIRIYGASKIQIPGYRVTRDQPV